MFTTQDDFIRFVKENPLAFIATIDQSQMARVRAIMICKVDENGIVFTTGKNKDFFKQLTANPGIELCFYAENVQVRITGTAIEIDDDIALKQEIVASRPFMQGWVEASGYDIMGLFRVSNASATYWSVQMPLSRKRFIKIFQHI